MNRKKVLLRVLWNFQAFLFVLINDYFRLRILELIVEMDQYNLSYSSLFPPPLPWLNFLSNIGSSTTTHLKLFLNYLLGQLNCQIKLNTALEYNLVLHTLSNLLSYIGNFNSKLIQQGFLELLGFTP